MQGWIQGGFGGANVRSAPGIHVSVPFTSLCQQIARCVLQAYCLHSENVATDFKTSIEAYFVEITC